MTWRTIAIQYHIRQGPAAGSSACVFQSSPPGFTCKFMGAAAAPPPPAAPDWAGARFAAARSALRRSWRDGGILTEGATESPESEEGDDG